MGPDYDAALLTTLFSQSPVGLHILDRELRVVRFNTGSPLTRGVDPAQVVGHTWRDLEWVPEDVHQKLQGVLATGEGLQNYLVPIRLPDSPFRERILSCSAFRLEEPDGRSIGLVVNVVDVTEQERFRRRLELLHRAGEHIGSTLDIGRTAQEVAEAAVPGLGDSAAVELLDSVLYGSAPAPGPVYERVTVRRVGFHTAPDQALGPVFPLGHVRVLRYGTPLALALSDLRPRHVVLTQDAAWLTEEELGVLQEAGLYSLVAVPLTARGVVLGLLLLGRAVSSPPFEASDIALASDLADRAAVSIDNARHYTSARALARLTQRTLVPARLPAHTAVSTAYAYLPITTSGVWYDVIPLSGARVALVAGEVAGQGMAVVTTMGRLRTVLGALALLDLTLVEVLERLHAVNGQLAEEYRPDDDSPAELTATCLCVVYDPATRDCVLASAGHPLPVLVRPDGHTEVVDAPQGPVLGRGEPRYVATELRLPEGSVLALRNAALVMADRGRELRLYREALQEPTADLWDACDRLLASLLPAEPRDDAMLLVARTRALGPDRVVSWRLPGAPESVAHARRMVQRQLTEWGLDELGYGTVLIASELVTNAVRYSEGAVELRLLRDAILTCEVSDTTSTAPRLRHAEDDDEGGRGLYLVAQLSERWGIRYTADGKTIWTEQPM